MRIRNLFFGAIIMTASGCTKDFVETNLKDKTVVMIAPENGLATTTMTHAFWWNKVDGAEKYNLQIVTPSFSAPQSLVLDTNVSEDHFSFTLTPGNYEWRVNAFNSSSQTEYSVFILTIDSTASLSGQTLLLVSPQDNYLTHSTSAITFKWDTLYSAEDYRLQILDSAGAEKLDVIVAGSTFSYPLGEGSYKWQVRAQNATSNTLYSVRTLTVDITAPPVSVPVFPANGDTITRPDTLLWTRNALAVGDSLFIYPDSLISGPTVQMYVTNTSYIYNAPSVKKYFWRFRSVDAAGNWSGYGTLRKFYAK